jgi:cyclohexyl-isocyanide hydratase
MIPHDVHLNIGSLLFEGVDQIDLTGPFEVLSRIPNATYRIYGKTAAPVRDLKGLRLTPHGALADAPQLDVLHIPGGFGQEPLMRTPRYWTGSGGKPQARAASFLSARARSFAARPA